MRKQPMGAKPLQSVPVIGNISTPPSGDASLKLHVVRRRRT